MAHPANLSIRRAGPDDAAALSELGVDTFVETFGHLYRPRDLRAFLAEAHSVGAWAHILGASRTGAWVAETPDRGFAGYLTAGPCKLPLAGLEATAGEVQRLYLRGPAQGKGLGSQLLVTALAWLEAEDFAPLYVGVWSGNAGAQRLYARFGFEKVGEYDFPVGEHMDREFIFRQRQRPPP